MAVQKLREKVHKYINHADETFLKMVHAMSKEYEEATIIGYDVEGNPISKDALKARAKAASSRVKEGNFVSQEELDKEVENW